MFFADEWNSWLWRTVAQVFFSRRVMGWLGRDPRLFTHVEGSVAEHVLARAEHAVTASDPSANPCLRFILRGNFDGCLPLYLRPEHFRSIRDRLDCVHVMHGGVHEACARFGPFDAFNLSDIFEYMSEAEFSECARSLAMSARAGALFAYWNMRAPRDLSSIAPNSYESDPRSAALHRRDQAFFYDAFHVSRRCG